MKLKYCIIFSMILLVMFSLTAISASEDVDLISSEGNLSDEDMLQIPDIEETDANQASQNPENLMASDDECDLSVNVSVEKTYVGDKFNRKGSVINWTVTVKSNEGLARNAKVLVYFSNNMEYVSCNKTVGEYDPSTRIWEIGDLSDSQTESIVILTRLLSDGHFNLTANATTDSMDVNLLNNFAAKNTKSGTGNNGSNITVNSSDRSGSHHYDITTIIEPGGNEPNRHHHSESTENRTGSNGTSSGGGSNGNRGGGSSAGNGGSIYSQYRSNAGSAALKSLDPSNAADSASSILEGENSNSSNWISKYISAVIPPYDYTRIPILIFALFIVALVAVIGYDKLKAQK